MIWTSEEETESSEKLFARFVCGQTPDRKVPKPQNNHKQCVPIQFKWARYKISHATVISKTLPFINHRLISRVVRTPVTTGRVHRDRVFVCVRVCVCVSVCVCVLARVCVCVVIALRN